MLLLFSHILAFSTLFVAAIFDVRTAEAEVPDWISWIGVVGGLSLHFWASLETMNVGTLMNLGLVFSSPFTWLQALGDPLLWSLGMGTVFSLYGWGLYHFGMWGGADAFAMSVIGFAAPTAIGSFSLVYPVNIFINILIAGFLYTLVFGFYKAAKNPRSLGITWQKMKDDEKRIAAEILIAGVLSAMGQYSSSFNGYLYFMLFLSMIFLYRFFYVIQEELMHHTVPVEDLNGWEVIAEEDGGDKKIRALTPEELDDIDAEEVEVQEGIRFMPIFPIALLVTDVLGGGIYWIAALMS